MANSEYTGLMLIAVALVICIITMAGLVLWQMRNDLKEYKEELKQETRRSAPPVEHSDELDPDDPMWLFNADWSTQTINGKLVDENDVNNWMWMEEQE